MVAVDQRPILVAFGGTVGPEETLVGDFSGVRLQCVFIFVDWIAIWILTHDPLSLLYSPRFAWGGRPHRRLFWPTQTYIQKIRQKHCFFQCFYNVFRRKHRNLRGFRPKVGPKHWFLQCFQCSGVKKRSIPWSPQTLENTAIYTVFFHFFHVPMPLANSNIHKKSFKNIVFFSGFTFFPSKTP